jgi:hypothetical protein
LLSGWLNAADPIWTRLEISEAAVRSHGLPRLSAAKSVPIRAWTPYAPGATVDGFQVTPFWVAGTF